MDRVFLDANVLFSAAYRPGSRIHSLWELSDVILVTSQYATDEAKRNLAQSRPANLAILEALVSTMEIQAGHNEAGVRLRRLPIVDKDRPILGAAIAARATHLITGDRKHLGAHFGKRIGGVLILTPAEYLRSKDS